jgi:hypothetical protein
VAPAALVTPRGLAPKEQAFDARETVPPWLIDGCIGRRLFRCLDRKGSCHMTNITATITGQQRDAIYELVVEHLSCLADLRLLIEREDFDTGKRLAREFSEDFRLLDDLGWGADGRLEVPLTISRGDLAETLRRLRAYAKGALSESPAEQDAREADELSRRRYQLALDTSSELLVELAAKEGARHDAR